MSAAVAIGVPPPRARVLVVDDSAVARAIVARLIGQSDRFEVAGSVATAAAALAFLASREVDVVVLDIHMPGVDGLTALPDLIAAGRGAKVLISSSAAGEGASATVQALALGAADTLVKPGPGERAGRFEAALLDKLDRLVAPSPAPGLVAAAEGGERLPLLLGPAVNAFDVIAIGASTGGIHALSQFLRALPPGMRTPMLVTQHLPAAFMPYFAAQLAVLAGRPCEVAIDRLRVRPGRVIVAPGDAHMRCVALPDGGSAVRLSHDPAVSGCLPSVDPMLESVAQVFAGRALALILSGMGRDGLDGARAVRAAGGCVLAQDQASSVVWGMPGAVATAGVSHAELDPLALARVVASGRRPEC